MVKMRAKVEGLASLRGQTKAVENRIKRGDLNNAAALRFFDVVYDKFDAEGPGWTALSKYRIERRSGSDHPILDWRGALRRAATSWTDDHKGPKIDMRVSGGPASKTWELSGPKVDNQWGGTSTIVRPGGNVVQLTQPITRVIDLPARPFWPMDAEWGPTVDKMMEPIDHFIDGWVSGDLGTFDAELSKSKNRKRTR